jgi:lincosamide nucleotidyltransferase A/C/D/E
VTAERVLEILTLLQASGVEATVDGGWGVDAPLGRVTREHEDLDLVVSLADVPRIYEALGRLGFALHETHRMRPPNKPLQPTRAAQPHGKRRRSVSARAAERRR